MTAPANLMLDSKGADADAMQRARAVQQERLEAAAKAAAAARLPQQSAVSTSALPTPAAPATAAAPTGGDPRQRYTASDPNSVTNRLARLEKGKQSVGDPLKGFDSGGSKKSAVSRKKGG